jgi:hypothetical protein
MASAGWRNCETGAQRRGASKSRIRSTEGSLFVVPSSGGTAEMLVSGEVGAAFPVWSPDGGFILFAVGRYRIESWAIVRSDRAERVVLTLEGLPRADDRDRAYFGRDTRDRDHVGYIDADTRAIFGRTTPPNPARWSRNSPPTRRLPPPTRFS